MLDLNKEYLQCDEHDEQLYERISHLESITDNIEEEMITFITAVLASPTSREQSSRAYGLIRMTDEVESIADCIQSVSIYRRRLFEKNEIISPQGWDDLLGFYDEITAYFHRIVEARNSMQVRAKLRAIVGESAELNAHANEVRTRHLDRIRDGSCQSSPALTYSDMAVSMRRIKNHSINFLEAYAGVPLD